ncbi:MAG TPA: pyridoxal phosphate-dependent aminotransferase [Proteobacteria bacterium]|nr:cystathionine beta-lyase PatB [bacterium BMS3Abin14]HDL52343.1 pyridoxal phosphate-dependent aminotransferase [Pseudomonadota bacterium]
MHYDFDTVIDRRGTHCEKWDGMEKHYGVSPRDGIAMWVADMEFLPPPEVNDAIRLSAEHGIHGYPGDFGAYHEAIVEWMARRHGWNVNPEWILTSHGVVMAVSLLVQTFCRPGDKVVLQTPVYYPFFKIVTGNGCEILDNPLVKIHGRYEMDLDALEAQVDRRTRMLILCSPHNPGGRVWKPDELENLLEFCLSRDILIVSDEIHNDLVYEGHTHTVLASLGPDVAQHVITCTSASKTFNLAGTSTGHVIIPNDSLRRRFYRQMARCGVHGPNKFGLLAATAAYTHGEPWLDELLIYLRGNRDRVKEVVEERMPGVTSMPLEGTYLSWLDFSGTGLPMDEIVRRVQQDARLALNHGPTFGLGGENHMRLNFACPRSMLNEALDRLARAFADV